MTYFPLEIPPGVAANGTEYQNKGRWSRANLVRWQGRAMMPVGGWSRIQVDPMDGVCRSLIAWRDNLAFRYLAAGTSTKLYIYSDRGSLVDITPTGLTEGRVDAIFGLGYGASDYGTGDYGTPRPGSTRLLLANSWSFDTFGENLVACSFTDGRLFEWAPDLDDVQPAQVIENAPTSCSALIVTPERHLVALGADGNPSRVAWSDREDLTTWTPSATNLAGDFDLQTTGRLYQGLRLRGQVLLLTSADAFTMSFVGSPFVYGFEQVGAGCGAASQQAAVAIDDIAVWMGRDAFYIYNGNVQPLTSDVQDYVYRNLNLDQASKIVAGINPEFNEIWWFYPSADSLEIDRYVAWNYAENHWTLGELSRTAFVPADVFRKPVMADFDGNLFRHEDGWTADGQPIEGDRFALSAPIELGAGGDRLAVVTQMVPDERNQGQAQVQFSLRNTPNSTEVIKGPFTLTDYVDLRFTARQVQMRIEGAEDADWRVGTQRLQLREGSRR